MRWILCLVVLAFPLLGCAPAEEPKELGENNVLAALRLSREPVRVEPQLAPSFPSAISFHPNVSSRLLMTEDTGAVSVWNIADPDQPIRELTLYTNAWTACFSPDGKSIAVGGHDGRVALWDARTGQREWHSQERHQKEIVDVAFSPTGDAILTASWDDTIRLWNLDGTPHGDPIETGHDVVNAAVFLTSGSKIATAGDDDQVRFWDLEGKPAGNPLTDHQDLIWSMDVSQDLDLLATGSEDGTLRLWSLDGTPRGEFPGHEGGVTSVSISSSRELVASTGPDGFVRLWNLDGSLRGAPLHAVLGTDGNVKFSPSGDILVSASEDGTVHLWDLRLPAGRGFAFLDPVQDVAISPTGSLAALATDWEEVLLWDLDRLVQLKSLRGHEGAVNSIAFSPSGDLLASGGDDGTVRLWNPDGSPHHPPRADSEQPVTDVAFSPGGDLLAASRKDGMVQIWKLEGEPYGDPFSAGDRVNALVFGPKGDLIATASRDGYVRLWSMDGSLRMEVEAHESGVMDVDFSPTGELLVSADIIGNVRFWTVTGAAYGEPIMPNPGSFPALSFRPDGEEVAVGGFSKSICFVSTIDLESRCVKADRMVSTPSLAYSANGESLISGSVFGGFQLLNLETPARKTLFQPGDRPLLEVMLQNGRIAATEFPTTTFTVRDLFGSLEGTSGSAHDGLMITLQFSPDGDRLISSGFEGYTWFWHIDEEPWRKHRIRYSILPHFLASFSPSGSYVALADWDDEIQIFRVGDELSLEATTDEHPEDISSLAFSPTEDLIASGSDDGYIRLWNLDGSAQGEPLKAQEEPIYDLVFSPSGDLLASGGRDGKVRLWNSSGSSYGQPFARHQDHVNSVSFSPSGNLLLSTAEDGTAILWNLDGLPVVTGTPGIIGFYRGAGFFNESTVWFSHADGSVGFYRTSDFSEVARLFLGRDGGMLVSPTGFYAGEGSLVENARFFTTTGAAMKVGDVQAARLYSPEEVLFAITGERSWWGEAWSFLQRTGTTVAAWYRELPPGAQVAGAYLALLLAILVIWLIRPGLLARWSMAGVEETESRWQLAIEAVTLVRWLGRSRRSLGQWLRTHHDLLEKRCFSDRSAVEERSRYVDLGNRENVDTWVATVRSRRPAVRWIAGPGGCGKSTLAFQLARQAQEHSRFPLVPVLVDHDWSGRFLDHLAGLLHVEDRRPTRQMVARLVQQGRLVVVLDGLSERRVEEHQHREILDLLRSGTLRHLVATSRDPAGDDFDFGDSREVRVGPLAQERLEEFVATYVEPGRVAEVLEGLAALGKGEPIRPLFARLAIRQLEETGEVPSHYADLVQRYVEALRPRDDRAINRADFFRAARIAAKACTENAWAPRTISSDILRGQLSNEPLPFRTEDGQDVEVDQVIEQLRRCGLLESTTVMAVERIRFAHDPIAEYLMAMHLVEHRDLHLERARMYIQNRGAAAEGLRQALEEVEQSRGKAA